MGEAMKRNKNIDIIRAIAILLVVIYHIFAMTNIPINNAIIKPFVVYGGIVGVSLFFILSGFGIYNSLKYQEVQHKKFNYHQYITKRLKRLAPQYYFSLIFLLFFTNQAIYLANEQILNIVSHFLFFNNLFYTMAGVINGVCWTIGIIFQFYLIAPYLYKAIEKRPWTTLILSFIISISLKVFMYHFIFAPSSVNNTFLYMTYGNQVFTAIEFFTIGMFTAKKVLNEKKYTNNLINIFLTLINIIILYFTLKLLDVKSVGFLKNSGLYSDCTLAYIWHNILSIVLGILIYFAAKIKLEYKSFISKIILFISKYEYGIYIWHLVIIENLINNSPYVKSLVANCPILVYFGLTLISILAGYIMTKLIDNFKYESMFEIVEKNSKNIFNVLFILLAIYCLYKSFGIIGETVHNINHYVSNDIIEVNESKKIADHAKNIIKDSKSCKYAYIDTETTGYLYFYQLRYYLAPCESIHYNSYAYIINYESYQEIYNYLSKLDVDYFIIRDNPILSNELNIKFDQINGSVFKKNKKSTNIHDLLIREE